jgi:hypothetical protein
MRKKRKNLMGHSHIYFIRDWEKKPAKNKKKRKKKPRGQEKQSQGG